MPNIPVESRSGDPPYLPSVLPLPRPPVKGRIVVVEQVYHQPVDAPPVLVESKYSRRIDSEEQPFGPRRLRVTEEWQELSAGWIEGVGLLVVSNEEGKGLQVQPSESERREIGLRVVELAMFPVPTVPGEAFSPIPWIIPPGESFRGSTDTLGGIKVRCRRGSARISYTIFPL